MGDNDPFPALGSVYKKASHRVNQLSQNVANINLDSVQDQKSSAKAWSPQNPVKAWGSSNLIQKLGMQSGGKAWTMTCADFGDVPKTGNAIQSEQKNYVDKWDFLSVPKGHSPQFNGWKESLVKEEFTLNIQVGAVDDNKSGISYDSSDSEVVFDSSDDDDDDFDSDSSEKSHDTRKKSKWFKAFFNAIDKLTVEEINFPSRQWHCPACTGGPGAIGWYRGLGPLMNHAKTKKKRRARRHRIFAETLYEEMRRKGILITVDSEAPGRWEGLNEKVKDHEVVWPPMVVIMNTRYGQEENGKWSGMGNRELLYHFSSYAALKARHSYGPEGHRGMSVLIFEGSAAGYLEAVHLHKHFKEQGRDRDVWNNNRVLFCSGGKRQLYGYIALKEDLEIFNQHCQGRSRLKFEMKSYQEMVERQIRKINKDNQLLVKFKNWISEEKGEAKALTESLRMLREELDMTAENIISRQQTKLLDEDNKEVVNSLEQYFKDQIRIVHQAIDEKEDKFDKLQLTKREKVKQSHVNPSTMGDTQRAEYISRVLKLVDMEIEEYEAEREKLIQCYEHKKSAILKKYLEQQLELEKEYENELTRLMKKYTSDYPQLDTGNSHQL